MISARTLVSKLTITYDVRSFNLICTWVSIAMITLKIDHLFFVLTVASRQKIRKITQKSLFIVKTGRDFKILYLCWMNHIHSKTLPTRTIYIVLRYIKTEASNNQKQRGTCSILKNLMQNQR